ncbi:MAG: hypothetical protein OJF52_001156 [Nitrospira sp.]|nr:MAG: hypothetical protein OJF52_001156 [Nitrospira sp.]
MEIPAAFFSPRDLSSITLSILREYDSVPAGLRQSVLQKCPS